MTPIKNCNIFNLLARVPNYDVIIFIIYIALKNNENNVTVMIIKYIRNINLD